MTVVVLAWVLASAPPEPVASTPEPTRDGVGLLAAGSVMVGAGAGLLLGGALEADQPIHRIYPLGLAIPGAVALLAGGGMIAAGLSNRRAYRHANPGWRDVEPNGRGLRIAGWMLMIGGMAVGTATTIPLVVTNICMPGDRSTGDGETLDCDGRLPQAQLISQGAGMGALVLGSSLFIPGAVRGARARRIQMQPNVAFGPRGASFGVSGRF